MDKFKDWLANQETYPRCPVCAKNSSQQATRVAETDFYDISCANCGEFSIEENALIDLFSDWSGNPDHFSHALAFRIRKAQSHVGPVRIDESIIGKLRSDPPQVPTVFEQVENLIIHLAENFGPGEATTLSDWTCQAAVGATSPGTLAWVLTAAKSKGWINGSESEDSSKNLFLYDASLTLDGWEWYDEIGRHRQSKVAFMAMPFGRDDLTRVVDEYFRPAVEQAGFRLLRLDDLPKAGIIDNQLRVQIRRSRLLICDITNNNTGAIWEAGFAEGLGRPVIYTCEESALHGAHFDIRNCQIIEWSERDLNAAAEELKATIRNTLPEEALLDD